MNIKRDDAPIHAPIVPKRRAFVKRLCQVNLLGWLAPVLKPRPRRPRLGPTGP
jgi:hypothetical protein